MASIFERLFGFASKEQHHVPAQKRQQKRSRTCRIEELEGREMLSVSPLASALADVFADYGDTAIYLAEPQTGTQSDNNDSAAVSTPAVLATAAPGDAQPGDLAVYNDLIARGCEDTDFTWENGRITELRIDVRELTGALDVSGCTALTLLNCFCNQLTTLVVSNNTALTTLYCTGNRLTALDVSKNTALTTLDCSYNQLTTLDMSKNTALTGLYCGGNPLTTLDVSKNTALEYLDCDDNLLTTLNLSNNTALQYLRCQDNLLTTLDVSKNTALGYLACGGNRLTTLNVSGCAALKRLYCNSNLLTTLNLSKNIALDCLYCRSNRLTTLDVSKNTALTTLDCSYNQLTTMDVSKNTALDCLYCRSNRLTTLDVSKNTALTTLYCNSNRLSALNMSGCTALTTLDCSENQLTFSTLEFPNHGISVHCAHQADITLGSPLPCNWVLNLSSEYMSGATTYTWKYVHDDSDVPPSLYTNTNGKFTFTGLNIGDAIYCEMTHANYPLLALKTTAVTIAASSVPTDPAKPAKAKAVAQEATVSTVTLTWTANERNAKYVIACTSHSGIAPKTVTGNEVVFTELEPGTKYKFTITASNAAGKDTITGKKGKESAAAVSVTAKTLKYTAPQIKAVPQSAASSSVTLFYKPSTAKVAGDYTVGYEIHVLLGKSPVATLESSDGQTWDVGSSGLSVNVFGTILRIEGLASANTKYTFVLKAVAVGLDGHVVQSLASKVSVKTAK